MAFKGKKTPVQEKDSSNSEIIRRFKANPLIFIGTILILIIVIVAFVLVPAFGPGIGGGDVDLTFGSYDKVPITYVPGNYFSQYYERVYQYYQSVYDPAYLQSAGFQIWQEAFNGAAVHTAILQELKAAGYTVPVKTVDREVARLPQFQENGRFSAALYQRMSNNDRLTLWRQVQDELATQYYFSDMSGLLKPAAESTFIGKMTSPQRSFDMVSFSVDDYPDTEYISYAETNPELFRSIHLSKISVNSSEREALQILNSIKDGTSTFEDAARTHSQDSYAEKGGDMGIKLAHELNQEISEEADREKIIGLGRGEISDVIKVDASWIFFRVEEAAQAIDTSDEANLEKVRSYVRSFSRGRMEDWAVSQAQNFIALANETSFDETLNRQSLEKRSFGPVAINYGDVDLFTSLRSFGVQQLSNSSSDENFWTTAFSTPVNTMSEPLIQSGYVVVLFPTEEIQAEESSVEGIASTFSDYWLSYMTEQSLRSYFLNSAKMENRFMETYFRYFLPIGN
ncbi:hypothetical protein AGMMS50293_17020 [Spirochaetia bacterium]|nr:hypothetical protein AGMMS50293_17020 [Spirochaetia bacterium]